MALSHAEGNNRWSSWGYCVCVGVCVLGRGVAGWSMSSLQSGKSGCDRLSLIVLTREQQLRFCFLFFPSSLPPSLPASYLSIVILTAYLSPLWLTSFPSTCPLISLVFLLPQPCFLLFCFVSFHLWSPASALPAAGDETKSCCSHCRQTSTHHHHHTPMTYHLFLPSCSLPKCTFFSAFPLCCQSSPLDVSSPSSGCWSTCCNENPDCDVVWTQPPSLFPPLPAFFLQWNVKEKDNLSSVILPSHNLPLKSDVFFLSQGVAHVCASISITLYVHIFQLVSFIRMHLHLSLNVIIIGLTSPL